MGSTRRPSDTPADALIVVDMQVGFLAGLDALPASGSVVPAVELLLAAARSADVPVIFLQNDGPIGAVDEPFQPGWELRFTPRRRDHVLRKSEDDGFVSTDLSAILQRLGARTLVICGLLSEMCVAATARSALRRGYGVLLPHDGHATYDVPAGPGWKGVPSEMAARAAEWSLGSEVTLCASTKEVRFAGRTS